MSKFKKYFIAACAAAVCGTLALFSITFIGNIVSSEEKTKVVRIIGSFFWISFIAELILFFMADRERKLFSVMEGKKIEYGRIGLLSFNKSRYGKYADIVMAVSFAAALLMFILKVNSRLIIIFTVSVFYLSLTMHSIFNGKNYRFLCESDFEMKEN